MGKVGFPAIPTVEDGQIASAATMNGYASGALALLGYSHAPFPLQHVRVPSEDVYWDSWPEDPESEQSIWKTWQYLASYTLYYKLHMMQDSGNAGLHWYYRILIYDWAGATWYVAHADDGTDQNYANREGTVDLTAVSDGAGGYVADHLTIGYLYKIYLQVKTENQTYHACCIPWGLGARKAVTGWVAPHNFAAETSAAGHFNDWRTDLLALQAALPTAGQALSQPATVTITFSETWTELTRAAYRYLPESLYVAVAASGYVGGTWQFRVVFEDDTAPAAQSAVVYTSDPIAADGAVAPDEYSWTAATASIDLTAGAAAAALAAAGIALTRGNWYRVIVQIYTTESPGRCWGWGAMLNRSSDGTPAGGWAAMNVWAHGDDDFGPTELDKVSANLVHLYSGNEALLYDVPAVAVVADGNGHTLVHRRRYLGYVSTDAPTIFYGPNLALIYSPSADPDWGVEDLDDVGIPYGTAYYMHGATGCYEGDAF